MYIHIYLQYHTCYSHTFRSRGAATGDLATGGRPASEAAHRIEGGITGCDATAATAAKVEKNLENHGDWPKPWWSFNEFYLSSGLLEALSEMIPCELGELTSIKWSSPIHLCITIYITVPWFKVYSTYSIHFPKVR